MKSNLFLLWIKVTNAHDSRSALICQTKKKAIHNIDAHFLPFQQSIRFVMT